VHKLIEIKNKFLKLHIFNKTLNFENEPNLPLTTFFLFRFGFITIRTVFIFSTPNYYNIIFYSSIPLKNVTLVIRRYE